MLGCLLLVLTRRRGDAWLSWRLRMHIMGWTSCDVRRLASDVCNEYISTEWPQPHHWSWWQTRLWSRQLLDSS